MVPQVGAVNLDLGQIRRRHPSTSTTCIPSDHVRSRLSRFSGFADWRNHGHVTIRHQDHHLGASSSEAGADAVVLITGVFSPGDVGHRLRARASRSRSATPCTPGEWAWTAATATTRSRRPPAPPCRHGHLHELPRADRHRQRQAAAGPRECRHRRADPLGPGPRPARLRLFRPQRPRGQRRGLRLCHGRVDKMDEVSQVETLSMGWCLECHRNPGPAPAPAGCNHRPGLEPDASRVPAKIRKLAVRTTGARNSTTFNPSTDCSTCHR